MIEGMLAGVICIAVGVMIIIFRKLIAVAHIAFQRRVWRFRYGETEVKISEIVYTIVGLAAMLFGVLFLFQVIRFR